MAGYGQKILHHCHVCGGTLRWPWYETAAAEGDAIGQYNLAKLYYTELDVPQDDVRAYIWVNLAAVHMTGDEQK
jgi:hypothetical protein